MKMKKWMSACLMASMVLSQTPLPLLAQEVEVTLFEEDSTKLVVKSEETQTQNVAEHNGKQYATLQEAISAASEGDTIKLLSDVQEDITVNKDIIIDGNEQYEIQGLSKIQQGTLQNLTLTPNANTQNGGFLVLGNSAQTKIRLENVTCKYSVTNRSSGSAQTLSGNQADITINNCFFTNEANNNGVTQDAPEWSYGLYINGQNDRKRQMNDGCSDT